ncbi:MAG TPA: DUF86 domain-containing protein [Desulfuromonadales bacterium]|nr:DUF86 domain-containing protein [Desulfuromonadales bacterium]
MKPDVVFLKHILDEIDFLLMATSGKTATDILEDGILQRACARSIEIIGEATKNVSFPLRKLNPQIQWKQFAAMRDKLIHQYFGVNWLIVWDVIENHLPGLRIEIGTLVTTLETTVSHHPIIKENSTP